MRFDAGNTYISKATVSSYDKDGNLLEENEYENPQCYPGIPVPTTFPADGEIVVRSDGGDTMTDKFFATADAEALEIACGRRLLRVGNAGGGRIELVFSRRDGERNELTVTALLAGSPEVSRIDLVAVEELQGGYSYGLTLNTLLPGDEAPQDLFGADAVEGHWR